MSKLRSVFKGQQRVMEAALTANRDTGTHPVGIGDGSELGWINMLRAFLPHRYQVDKGVVFDSGGKISESIDIIVYDRQYSPLIRNEPQAKYVTAESVYAVFEVKQAFSKKYIEYAADKVSSVRELKRTSTVIPHAEGIAPAKQPERIIGGILATESSWAPPLGPRLESCLRKLDEKRQLDLGCALRHGSFEAVYVSSGTRIALKRSLPDTSLVFFYISLLSQLQQMGTVPAIDYAEYGAHLLEVSGR